MKKMAGPFINGFSDIKKFVKKYNLAVKSDKKSSNYTDSNDKIYNYYNNYAF
jgi:hypothetical protein